MATADAGPATGPGPMLSGLAGMCADVAGGAAAPAAGTPVIAWGCHGGTNQKFALQGSGAITAYDGALCLDVAGGQARDGDPVIVWTCHGGANQRWARTAAGELRTAVNGKCLDIAGGAAANGAKLILWPCHGGANQRWTVNDAPVSVAPLQPIDSTTARPVGVAVYPGQSIQAAVNANPAGTTFILKAGTHVRQTVVPKDGTSFVGEQGTVMDGGGSTEYAFWPGNARPYPAGVRIQGVVVQNYAPPLQMGAVRAGGHAAADGARGWVVQDCEIRNNATGGIRLGDRMRVIHNNVHHNGQIGITGIGDSVLVENNEIAYNNYRSAYDPGFEAGGTKFVLTRWLTVRGNFSHHNTGPGLWTDGNNIDVLYENNRVEDNTGMGIFHEISYRAVIRNNAVRRNGFGNAGWVYGAGIMISSSGDVEVYGNTVADNYNAITAAQQNRTADLALYGPHVVQNVYVHDNDISLGRGLAGIGQDVGDLTVFTARNNRFRNNTYRLGTAARPFEWANGQRTDGEWRGYGQDVTGVFTR